MHFLVRVKQYIAKFFNIGLQAQVSVALLKATICGPQSTSVHYTMFDFFLVVVSKQKPLDS